MAKAAILNFDFDQDDFEELSRRYIADSEFRSTKHAEDYSSVGIKELLDF